MASLVTNIADGWNDFMDKSDPRTTNWFMMDSLLPTVLIITCYIYFVTKLGPKIMENRKPYDLKKTLLVYNFIQVLVSVYLFHEGGVAGWFGKYSFICQPVDYSNSPDGIRMAHTAYWYYISKLSELADTVFFVLRKKNNQITPLHVFHHGTMPISVWFGVKFTPGGHATFFGLINTWVHIWMYLYYFLAALGPSVQKYLWWKKYLTSMQLLQFILVAIHVAQLIFIECDFPKAVIAWIGVKAVIFFVLFKDFYNKAYGRKGGKKSKFNVSKLEVDPHREGIKQSDLWVENYDHLVKKRRAREAKKQQATPAYADQYKMATGYISDEGLKNHVFLDNNRSADE